MTLERFKPLFSAFSSKFLSILTLIVVLVSVLLALIVLCVKFDAVDNEKSDKKWTTRKII